MSLQVSLFIEFYRQMSQKIFRVSQEIHLSSAGLRSEFFQKLSSSMHSNQYCNLVTFDISINFVEDKGLAAISQVVAHLPRGTKHLNLAHCGLSGKGVNPMATALVSNKVSWGRIYSVLFCSTRSYYIYDLMLDLKKPPHLLLLQLSLNSLTYLNLAGNVIKDEVSDEKIFGDFYF